MLINRLSSSITFNLGQPLLIQILLPRYSATRSSSSTPRSGTMSAPHWKVEKERILSLPLDKKRLTYKAPDYVLPSSVKPWSEYARQHDLSKPIEDDLKELQNTRITAEFSKNLAEKVAIFQGDITKLEVDAIVNAANSRLQAGGGVDGAIHRAAGPLLQEECHSLGGCPTGEAKITGGYNLPAKYVIHTVGPQDKSAAKLNSCYANCLSLVPQHGIKTIAFPCISTGIYGFPNRLAAHIALGNARKALEYDAKGNSSVEKVIFCTFMPVDVEIYETLMQLYFPLD